MTAFLQSQLDFILFFYGLAFILLGASSLSIAKGRAHEAAWTALAAFGFAHGAGEWLDLSALMISDSPGFAVVRTWIMVASFMFLMEFPRRQAAHHGIRIAPAWLYAGLALGLGLVEVRYGLIAANGLARYAVGFVGALGAGLWFIWRGASLGGARRRLCWLAGGGFVLYGVAAGLVVRAAPFWPANLINQDSFAQVTGVPVQLLRGTLACWLAFSIWALDGVQLTSQMQSARYADHRRRQFAWTVVAMIAILTAGWTLTQFLGGIYQRTVEARADGDIKLLSSRFAGETTDLDHMVRALAGAPSTSALLSEKTAKAGLESRATLDLDVSASGAARGYLLDRTGAVVAQSPARAQASSPFDPDLGSAFRRSLSGAPGHAYFLGGQGAAPDYVASYPIRGPSGGLLGVAVLETSLDQAEADVRDFSSAFYLVDPNGLIALTNRAGSGARALWPATTPPTARHDGRLLLDRPVADRTWSTVAGARAYLRRQYLGDSRWSVVMITPVSGMFASRILGIVVTLLLTVTILVYLRGRDRIMRDGIYMDRHLELQSLARDLHSKATTDPLTGLFNRLKFDEALAQEIARAERYHTPFSLILFDIDHFKAVNDTYGHPAGDQVLIELAQLVSRRIRSVDLLARWGGEEFVILAPGTPAATAVHLAEQIRLAIGRMEPDLAGPVSCSFGVAQFEPGDSGKSAVARADAALYRAKAQGRNRVELIEAPSLRVSAA